MSKLSTFTFDDLEIPGLDFKVKATSVMDTETLAMKAVLEVQGGMGRITIEYENDRTATLETDELIRSLHLAIVAMTGRMAEEVLFRDLMEGIERELGGEDGAA